MKSRLLYYLFIAAILTAGSLPLHAQLEKVPWNYPVKPGTEEWKNFSSRIEMVEACQIPESILKNSDTESLIDICLNYPFLHDIMFYNNSQLGFDVIAKEFNGLTELLERTDVGILLLKRYMKIDPEKVENMPTSFERGKFMASLVIFEQIISQEDILSKLSKIEKIELVKEAKLKFNSKIKHADRYQLMGIQSTPLIIGRVMNYDKYSKFQEKSLSNKSYKNFVETGNTFEAGIIEDIIILAEEYINSNQ